MTPSRAPPGQLALDLSEPPDDQDDGSFDYFVRSNRPDHLIPPEPPADTREDEP